MVFMRKAVLYTALCLFANAGLVTMAAAEDFAAVEALREGDMKKLAFHTEPVPAPATAFSDIDGAEHSLADYRGKWVVLNLWATWCAPCRAEMPTLGALQTALGGERFEVVTVATGRNPVPAIQRFFAEAGVVNLPALVDPDRALSRPMGVMGLPVSVILDPEGNEVARLIGEADWSSESAQAILTTLIAGK